MKGMAFGNSPAKVDLTKKTGLGPRAEIKRPKISSQDEEQAYENAQNDYDTDNPTKKQLAESLRKIKAEKGFNGMLKEIKEE